ncbi:hypothetical protein FB451DRAFT_1416302 [Mycena latifolia]|nr:hypothetical protein FB451DRAFT_1416302 [Mycena latifolia]
MAPTPHLPSTSTPLIGTTSPRTSAHAGLDAVLHVSDAPCCSCALEDSYITTARVYIATHRSDLPPPASLLRLAQTFIDHDGVQARLLQTYRVAHVPPHPASTTLQQTSLASHDRTRVDTLILAAPVVAQARGHHSSSRTRFAVEFEESPALSNPGQQLEEPLTSAYIRLICAAQTSLRMIPHRNPATVPSSFRLKLSTWRGHTSRTPRYVYRLRHAPQNYGRSDSARSRTPTASFCIDYTARYQTSLRTNPPPSLRRASSAGHLLLAADRRPSLAGLAYGIHRLHRALRLLAPSAPSS